MSSPRGFSDGSAQEIQAAVKESKTQTACNFISLSRTVSHSDFLAQSTLALVLYDKYHFTARQSNGVQDQ